MRKRPACLPLFFLVFLISCAAPAPAGSMLTLPSGRQIKALSAGPVFGAGGKRLGVIFRYETELKVSDKTALRKEVDEIFSVIRQDAEREKETSLTVSAIEKSSGTFIKSTHGYNFVFERAPDGSWHCLDDQK